MREREGERVCMRKTDTRKQTDKHTHTHTQRERERERERERDKAVTHETTAAKLALIRY